MTPARRAVEHEAEKAPGSRQLHADAAVLRATTLPERAATHQLTTVELAAAWGVLGLALYFAARRRQPGA